MITTSDKELLQAKLHKTPLSVFVSVGSAAALASLVIVRILWTYQQAGKPMGRALRYAGLIALFIFSNALSLLTKSKSGYVLVMVAALVPALGSLALSLHFFSILLIGKYVHDQSSINYQFDRTASIYRHTGSAGEFIAQGSA